MEERFTMKKAFALMCAAALLAGCSSSTASATAAATTAAAASTAAAEESAAATAEAVQTVGEYTLYNETGETVTELYLYPTGSSEKGDNLAGDHGFMNAHATKRTYDAGDAAADTKLTLEFTTESGYNASFTTLSIETAPITLLAEDALTGATPIAFQTTAADYTIYNETGENVTELYLYPTGSSDKGDNLISGTDGAAVNGGYQEVTFDSVPEGLIGEDGKVGSFTLEFTTESGYNASFTTLSYEVAPIMLIAEDDMTGATPIQFGAPTAD